MALELATTVDLTSVTEGGVLLDVDEYVVHRAGYLERTTLSSMTTFDEPVATVVVFTHGYAAVPFGVKGAVLGLAGRLTDIPGNLQRVGQVQYATNGDSFTDAEKADLRMYRIPAQP
jgi:hypothetical protein